MVSRSRASVRAVILATLVTACTAPGPSASPTPSPATGLDPCERGPSTSTVETERPAASATALADEVAALAIGLEPLLDGLASPVQILEVPGSSGLRMVTERAGVLRVVDGETVIPEPFLDLRDIVSTESEQGLLSMAFHPGYEDNRRLFVSYSTMDGGGVIVEYARSFDPFRADLASACLILRVDQPTADHNGGLIRFGPDGYLYAGFGDGGPGGDPNDVGQRLDLPLSKILRLDVDAAGPYAVPADNPFVDTPDALGETWAMGFRNPWRFSFDPVTHDLWIGDVGQARFEEVNRAPAAMGGANFGWSDMEGPRCYQGECDPTDLTLPLATHTHDDGDCAIVGGHVYRGSAIPGLVGWYVYGDFCSGRLRAIDASVTDIAQEPVILADTDTVMTSIDLDQDGELIVVSIDGIIARVVAGG